MRKIILPIVVATLALSACNSAKSTLIPTDPEKWGEISEQVKSLDDDDREAVTKYMMRMTLGAAFSGGKAGIPPGTTIGDAIDQQHEWQKKQQQEEAEAAVLKAKVEAQKAADAAKIKQAATVAITDVSILPENMMAGRYSDRLNMEIAVQNKTAKQISGIKGTVNFDDQFGSRISSTNLSLDEDVKPNESRNITGYGRDLNQFEDSDKKLASIPFSKMKVTFVPEMIVFADGSKIGSVADDEN